MSCLIRFERFAVFLLAGVVLASCSSSSGAMEDEGNEGPKLLAHRGIHQTFSTEGVDDETCTATKIDPPVHGYIENTIPSMEAAFSAGAVVVEIDIAPTSDGVLVVFHDWDVGCRTEATGEVRSLTWAELSKLDVGYGYTADGETYPLRGQGVGLMPRLEDVFAAFPDGRFLINFKSNDPSEATLLQEVVEAEGASDQVWAVYGAPTAVQTYLSGTSAKGFSEDSIRACLVDYVAAADINQTFPSCRNTVVVVPSDMALLLPGWPETFVEAMGRHNSDVIISGPDGAGIDSPADLADVPSDIDVYVWTNRVDAIT